MKQIVRLTCALLVFIVISGTVAQEWSGQLPSKLLIHTLSSDFPNTLYVIEGDGEELTPLIQFEPRTWPNGIYWSPDGQKFAIVERIPGEQNICIYHVTGEFIRCDESAMAWNSDYYRFPLLYLADDSILALFQSDHHPPQIVSLDIENGEVDILADLPVDLEAERLERIYWSSTGQYVAYQTTSYQDLEQQTALEPPPPPPLNLYVFDLEQHTSRLLTRQSFDNCVSWSNGGQSINIVMKRWREGPGGILKSDGLTSIDLEEGAISRKIPQHNNQEVFGCPFTWTHDNSQMAFHGRFEDTTGQIVNGLFLVPDDGDEAIFLAETPNIIDIQWSPDNRYLAIETLYSAFGDVRIISQDGGQRIYSIEHVFVNPRWQPIPPGD